jgi:Domain of unknown function (DUF5122) beta-propeller
VATVLVLATGTSHADDGALDTSWKVQVPIISTVHRVFVAPDGKILFSPGAVASPPSDGGYYSYHTAPLVRLLCDGSLDIPFLDAHGHFQNWSFGGLNSLAFQSDGGIVFGSEGGGDNNSLVQFRRWNAQGSLDFVRGLRPYGVKCVVLQPDGKILMGGFFDSELVIPSSGVNPEYPSRINVARANPDGSWDSLNEPVT